jgi:hypothetical protein
VAEVCLAIICLAIIAFASWREIHFNKERNQLIDRLMCRNLAEYQQYNPSRKPLAKSSNPTYPKSDEELALEEDIRIEAMKDRLFKAGKLKDSPEPIMPGAFR